VNEGEKGVSSFTGAQHRERKEMNEQHQPTTSHNYLGTGCELAHCNPPCNLSGRQ